VFWAGALFVALATGTVAGLASKFLMAKHVVFSERPKTRGTPGQKDPMTETRIAVLVPCHNEAATVAAVVRGFRMALPAAQVYVYDNNSSDATAARALEAGATVRRETCRARDMSSGECWPTLTPISTSWLTATTLTIPHRPLR